MDAAGRLTQDADEAAAALPALSGAVETEDRADRAWALADAAEEPGSASAGIEGTATAGEPVIADAADVVSEGGGPANFLPVPASAEDFSQGATVEVAGSDEAPAQPVETASERVGRSGASRDGRVGRSGAPRLPSWSQRGL